MRLSAMLKIKNKQPKKESKPETRKFIACKNCGATNVTLVKGTDSYYCKFCYDKLFKRGK